MLRRCVFGCTPTSSPVDTQQQPETSTSTSVQLDDLSEQANIQRVLGDPVETQQQPETSTSMSVQQVDLLDQSFQEPASDVTSELCFDMSAERNSLKLKKEHQKTKYRNRAPSSVTSEKYRVYQRNIKKLRRRIYCLRKEDKSNESRLNNAERILNQTHLEKVMKNMKPAANFFTNMQYYKTRTQSTGQRFSIEEKVLSLSLFNRSPKCYSLMSKYFMLPSTKSLKRLLAHMKLGPGINTIFFKELKQSISLFDVQDKMCSVIFGEMSISPRIHHDLSRDELKRFRKYSENEIANHVLVFMVRGVYTRYKQPVAYYFTNSLESYELKTLVKTVIRNVQKTGLIVLATVCDQSTVNVGAIEELIKETKASYLEKEKHMPLNYFEINKKKIIPLYDVPHLIKAIRNDLLTKNMTYVDYDDENKTKTVKWEYLQQLYVADKSLGKFNFLYKLTEEHIVPEKIKKNSVRTAAQIFSHRVAVATHLFSDRGTIPLECQDMISIILLLNNLFDSFNCNSLTIPDGNVYMGPVKRNSPHQQLWEKGVKYLKSIKFIINKKVGNKSQKCESVVPSITNFIKTIEGIQELWKTMSQKCYFRYMFTRNFNKGPVESFFRNIRKCGAKKTAPNAIGFEQACKILLLNNFSAPRSTNSHYEDDEELLVNLDFFFTKKKSGSRWIRAAQHRSMWKALGEAFVRKP